MYYIYYEFYDGEDAFHGWGGYHSTYKSLEKAKEDRDKMLKDSDYRNVSPILVKYKDPNKD